MSFGLVGVERMPTASPLRATSLTVSTCAPVVIGWYWPAGVAKYKFFEPELSTLKYTPALSGAQNTPEIGRSSVPETRCGFDPSEFMTQSLPSAQAEWSTESADMKAISLPSGE